MIDSADCETLLRDNRDLLAKFAAKHDLSGVCEIDISAPFVDAETAKAARSYVKEEY